MNKKKKFSVNIVAFLFFLPVILVGLGGSWSYYSSNRELLLEAIQDKGELERYWMDVDDIEKKIIINNEDTIGVTEQIINNKKEIERINKEVKDGEKLTESRKDAIKLYTESINDLNEIVDSLQAENRTILEVKHRISDIEKYFSLLFWSKASMLFFMAMCVCFLLLIVFQISSIKTHLTILFVLPLGFTFIISALLDFTNHDIFKFLNETNDYTLSIVTFIFLFLGSLWGVFSMKNSNVDLRSDKIDLDSILQLYFSKNQLSEELFLRGSVLLDVIRIRDRLLLEQNRIENKASVNLMLGVGTTIIALIFLITFFVWKGFIPCEVDDIDGRWFCFISYYLPRLGFIIFIEIFSFYFLRLYKMSMAEIKFYQNERTNVDMKILSLRIAMAQGINNGDYNLLISVVESLKNTERNFVLHKGDSTVDIELRKLQNEDDQKYSITKEDLYRIFNVLINNSKDKKNDTEEPNT